jgi:phosphate uptake regulator
VRTGGDVTAYKSFASLEGFYRDIVSLLPDLERAILDSNDVLARDILQRYQQIKSRMKGAEAALYTADLAGAEAIATTLLTRVLWRVNSHIGNVASGVVFPLENIDFVSRGLRGEVDDDAK